MDGGKHGAIESDALEGRIGTLPVGERLHEVREVAVGVWVETPGGTQFPGDRKSGVFGVDRNDLGETGDSGSLQGEETDHARADDHGRVARGHGGEPHGVHADRDSLDHRGLVEAEPGGKCVEDAGGDGDEFGEGPVAAVGAQETPSTWRSSQRLTSPRLQ